MPVSLSSPLLNSDGGGGGGGGPVASPFTGGGQGRGAQRQGQDSGGDNPSDILAELQAEIRMANQRAAQAESRTDGLAGVLGNVQKAFGGGKQDESEPDWYEGDDGVLRHLLELEKQGKSHPMTATLARELRKSQAQQAELMQLVQSLKSETQELRNPSVQNDERAFSQIDDTIVDELTSIYGEAQAPLHRAVAANIAADIARIQKEFPGKWEELRRDQNKLAKIVKHHITAIIPPVARQAIAKQVEDNTPVTMQTLNSAWREFQGMKHTLDPQARGEIATELRRQILAEQFMQNRRLPGGPRRR